MIAVPQAAVDLAKPFEGFHRVPKANPSQACPYLCPAGFWTVGYGHLCAPRHPPITEAEAESIWRTIGNHHWRRPCAIARRWLPSQ